MVARVEVDLVAETAAAGWVEAWRRRLAAAGSRGGLAAAGSSGEGGGLGEVDSEADSGVGLAVAGVAEGLAEAGSAAGLEVGRGRWSRRRTWRRRTGVEGRRGWLRRGW